MRIPIVCLAGLAMASSANAAVVLFDPNMADANWSRSPNVIGGTGFMGVNQQPSGGNPGTYQFVTVNVPPTAPPGSFVTGVAYCTNTVQSYLASVSGNISSITIEFDAYVFVGPGGAPPNPLVSIDFMYWSSGINGGATPVGIVPISAFYFPGNSWTHFSQTFTLAQLPGMTANGGGTPVTFGYVAHEHIQGLGSFLGLGIDNWRVTIVPTPGAAVSFLAAGAALGTRRRRAMVSGRQFPRPARR